MDMLREETWWSPNVGYSNPQMWSETSFRNPDVFPDPDYDLEEDYSSLGSIDSRPRPERQDDPGMQNFQLPPRNRRKAYLLCCLLLVGALLIIGVIATPTAVSLLDDGGTDLQTGNQGPRESYFSCFILHRNDTDALNDTSSTLHTEFEEQFCNSITTAINPTSEVTCEIIRFFGNTTVVVYKLDYRQQESETLRPKINDVITAAMLEGLLGSIPVNNNTNITDLTDGEEGVSDCLFLAFPVSSAAAPESSSFSSAMASMSEIPSTTIGTVFSSQINSSTVESDSSSLMNSSTVESMSSSLFNSSTVESMSSSEINSSTVESMSSSAINSSTVESMSSSLMNSTAVEPLSSSAINSSNVVSDSSPAMPQTSVEAMSSSQGNSSSIDIPSNSSIPPSQSLQPSSTVYLSATPSVEASPSTAFNITPSTSVEEEPSSSSLSPTSSSIHVEVSCSAHDGGACAHSHEFDFAHHYQCYTWWLLLREPGLWVSDGMTTQNIKPYEYVCLTELLDLPWIPDDRRAKMQSALRVLSDELILGMDPDTSDTPDPNIPVCDQNRRFILRCFIWWTILIEAEDDTFFGIALSDLEGFESECFNITFKANYDYVTTIMQDMSIAIRNLSALDHSDHIEPTSVQEPAMSSVADPGCGCGFPEFPGPGRRRRMMRCYAWWRNLYMTGIWEMDTFTSDYILQMELKCMRVIRDVPFIRVPEFQQVRETRKKLRAQRDGGPVDEFVIEPVDIELCPSTNVTTSGDEPTMFERDNYKKCYIWWNFLYQFLWKRTNLLDQLTPWEAWCYTLIVDGSFEIEDHHHHHD